MIQTLIRESGRDIESDVGLRKKEGDWKQGPSCVSIGEI
jgi:hypothetical protein